jgi:hypothetical protein
MQDATAQTLVYVNNVLVVNQTLAGQTAGRFAFLILRDGGNWRAGLIKNGVLTWYAAAAAAGFPVGLTRAFTGNSESSTVHLQGPIIGQFRKSITDTSDAGILDLVGDF